MKYRIEEYKLKNGIEDISIIFDEKYQLLTTFMSCDVLPFEKWIKSGFDRVLSGKSEYEEVNGNVCCAEISPKTTKVYDNLAEDAMGNWCEVDTKELRQLIDEWCDKVQKFKMSITTKPPTGRLNSQSHYHILTEFLRFIRLTIPKYGVDYGGKLSCHCTGGSKMVFALFTLLFVIGI